MSEKNKNETSQMTAENEADQPRNSRGRRATLKKILAGSGAVAAAHSAPEAWKKPLVDSVMLPAHAATTDDTDGAPGGSTSTTPVPITGSLAANWILGDDAPGGSNTGMTGPTNAPNDFLYDDGTDSTITATVNPAVAGVVVALNISVSGGTTFTGFDTPPAPTAVTNGAGVATFLSGISLANDDFGDTPGDNGSITMTFTATGHASHVVSLTLV